ncbi:uncharacterized protein BT62DRAFT_727841 [Guyanagaster necrorhizus]|uniref:SANT domain-containing protein n=1 Tax=Guyanagaster necrorhizus TaxID=856835 RepID=A0A9P7VZR9_9AGAR|nr:uncharacterized protein BT62DRAFT_727841 [Guyanagaster necrorhizus MCA 3950]KAG7448781.1 hypothetical protein BT62DRAFT_727841 [Guyanagaster necrorhizus MCA 3950]
MVCESLLTRLRSKLVSVAPGQQELVTDSISLGFAHLPSPPVSEAKESYPEKDEILPAEVDIYSLKARKPPIIDFTEDDIPRISEASSLQDVIRASIMTKLLHCPQTQEEWVERHIRSNQAFVRPHTSRTSTTPEQLLEEINSGECLTRRLETFVSRKDALIDHLQQRQASLTAKVKRLQEEYLFLHERWLSRCRVLDAQNKLLPAELEPPLPSSSRTTRRTAATLGDAVRSDFEMEQIIASLGNDEATDPAHLSLKNHAVIPDMISVLRGSVDYVYDDTNLLVENPLEYYRPRTGMDDWTPEEEQIFQDRYAAHPKQFGIIADYISNKTAAQCVSYYYLHKKQHIDFRKVVSQHAPKRRRRRTGKQKANALLTDIRQHDAEVYGNADGQESTGGRGRSKRVAARKVLIEETPTSTPTPEPEQKVRAKRRRTVAVRSGLSINNEEEGATERKPKRTKRQRKVKSAAIVDESQASIVEMKFIDQSDPSQRLVTCFTQPYA